MAPPLERPPDCSQGFMRIITYDDGNSLHVWCVDHSRWQCPECRPIRRWEELHGTILPGVLLAKDLYLELDPKTDLLKKHRERWRKRHPGSLPSYVLLWVSAHAGRPQQVLLATWRFQASVEVPASDRVPLVESLADDLVQPRPDAWPVSSSRDWGKELAPAQQAHEGAQTAPGAAPGEPEPENRPGWRWRFEQPTREVVSTARVYGVAFDAYFERARQIAKELPAEVRPTVHRISLCNRNRSEGGSTPALSVSFPEGVDWRTRHFFHRDLSKIR